MSIIKTKGVTANEVYELYSILFQNDFIKLFYLDEREITILKMKWIDYKDFNEIAEHLYITPTYVGQIYYKALRRLRVRISIAVENYKKHIEIINENQRLQDENNFLKKRFEKLDLKEKKIFSPGIYNDLNNSVYQIKIRNVDFSVRAMNSLRGSGCETIGDIMDKKRTEFLHIRNFGKKTLKEIEDFLKKEYGLKLNK